MKPLKKDEASVLVNNIGAAGIFAGLIALYALATDGLHILNPFIFPGPLKIGKAFTRSLPQIWDGIRSSLALLIPALTAAFTLGISAGTLLGLKPRLRALFMPLFRALNPIPSIMLIPYAIAVMPTFRSASIMIIAIGVFWPVARSTINGIVYMEPRWLDNAHCLGIRGAKLVFRIILPGVMPQVFAGIESGLIMSFVLLTVAEIFGARAGLGYFIQYYADFAEYDRVIMGILVLSTTVVLLMAVFDRIRRRVLRWTFLR